jgi:hypothetical protein
MPSITFRYISENEVTLTGNSYEDIYQRFHQYQQGSNQALQETPVKVLEPRGVHVLFSLDKETGFHDIEKLTGSFKADILSHTGPITPAVTNDTDTNKPH